MEYLMIDSSEARRTKFVNYLMLVKTPVRKSKEDWSIQ